MTAGQPQELAGKVALITGAVRRIGRATAVALAGRGAAVVINARSSAQEAAAVVREIEAAGGRALHHLADVTDEAQVRAMVDRVLQTFGRIDILVNNAANRKHSAFTEMSFAEWREITGVILDGAFLCARAVLPAMIANGGGAIINIGGLSGHTGAFDRAHVATAKAGLVGLTKALAVEFAARGVTVNCVAPGKIGGKRAASAGDSVSLPGGGEPLVGRPGTPEDVAAMILTLCLPTGRFITGQTIHVNGGLYLP
ncbi:MAG: SDR family NAD(P)-dependent oxidoreductase [Dongiaceae bacterium]